MMKIWETRRNKFAFWLVSAMLSVIALLLIFGVRTIRRIDRYHYRPGDEDRAFTLTPNGQGIIFTGDGRGKRDLYLLNLQTSHVTTLTKTPDYESDPAVSPDGRFLTYAIGKEGERADHIVIRSLDGTTSRQLTHEDSNDGCPFFCKDGESILFIRSHKYLTGGLARWGTWADAQLCQLSADGQKVHALTARFHSLNSLSVSSDNRNVYCEIDDLEQGHNIWRFVLEGDNAPVKIQQITREELSHHPAVSRDGKQLVFVSSQRGNADSCNLVCAEPDGTNLRPIVKNMCIAKPVFSSDGKHIYFLSFVTSKDYERMVDGLWQVDSDGKNLKRIADENLFRHPLK